MLASGPVKTGRDPEVPRLVLRGNPVLTTAPVPEEQVPQRGTLRQIAGYLADAVQETAAAAGRCRRQCR
ncbi:hypothetical protein KN815_24775 [Streptomyces sp. 4503]|uniref:Uncharacterized protein n=1 Tax=Streptomyces niphimycinicus TaxID=2842201 RepID=A0ABS6CJZ9_9ACTN|nr:hypothetical protein [Streptomyces niphimycinicus]